MNGSLRYRKSNRPVPNEHLYTIKANRVYKDGRLKGYLGKQPIPKLKVPKGKLGNIEIGPTGTLRYKKSGRPVSAKYFGGIKEIISPKTITVVVMSKSGNVLGAYRRPNIRALMGSSYSSIFAAEPTEIELPSTRLSMPEGFTESGLDPFFSDYKQVLEVLGPTIGPSAELLGPGVISVEQRSYVNFASALNAAVEAGFITEEEADEYFKWYNYADEKGKGQLWDELYDYYEDQGFDYFE